MKNKFNFLTIFALVILVHVYLFAQLKVQEEKVAKKPSQTLTQINIQNVVIKKQEKKELIQPKKEEPKKIELPKKLPKTESQNKIKTQEKEIKKEPIKKPVEKVLKKEPIKEPIKEPKKAQTQKQATPPVKTKTKKQEVSPEVLKAVQNEYLLKLKDLIERNKEYPKNAKRLKQEGVVYISFTILNSGEITNIKISKKSKYKRLNKAAYKIMHKIKRFEPIPKELNKANWDITVPVSYQII